jgi:hypothetical protein
LEPSPEPLTVSSSDADLGPLEQATIAHCNHAFGHLDEAYWQLGDCGLFDSNLQSHGVTNALMRLMAQHLARHCINSHLDQDATVQYLGDLIPVLATNFGIQLQNFAAVRDESLMAQAKEQRSN